MARHEFGIMKNDPEPQKSYDEYEPQKYNCISVDEEYIEKIVDDLDNIDFYWHALDMLEKGLAYTGITLIPPVSIKAFIMIIKDIRELDELKCLLEKAFIENKWIIHFGI